MAIYDQSVKLSRLLGKNKEFIEREIPHLEELLRDTPEAALKGADVVVVGHAEPDVRALIAQRLPSVRVVDLVGYRELQVPGHPGYEGICW